MYKCILSINKYTSAVWPGVISLFTLLSPIVGGHWTNDGARVLYLVMSTVHCPGPKLPMFHQLMNVILSAGPDQTRQSSHQTAVSTPRPAPARLAQTAGGTPAPCPGGGLVRPRSSIHSTLHSTQLYCTSLFAQLDNHCLQSGSHGPAHCTDCAVNWGLCFQQIKIEVSM